MYILQQNVHKSNLLAIATIMNTLNQNIFSFIECEHSESLKFFSVNIVIVANSLISGKDTSSLSENVPELVPTMCYYL